MNAFLSYPSEKLQVAKQVYNFTTALGVSLWFDKESLVGGQDWDRERAAAQRSADLTLLVCAPETVGRAGVIQREIKDILRRIEDQPQGHTYVVSLRTEDFRLPPELARYHYIDLFEPDWQSQLARALRHRIEQLGGTVPNELLRFLRGSPESSRPLPQSVIYKESEGISIQADYFRYDETGPYWDYVNSTISEKTLRSLYSNWRDLRSIRSSNHSSNFDPDLWWSLNVEEFFRQGTLLSLRFFESIYIGGAHGNHVVTTKNFGDKEGGLLEFQSMFGRDESVLDYVIQLADIDIKHRILRDPSATDAPWWPDAKEERWRLLENFSFDSAGITFNFSPYEVLHFAAGFVEVFVAWRFFKDRLAAPYRDGPIARLIEAARG